MPQHDDISTDGRGIWNSDEDCYIATFWLEDNFCCKLWSNSGLCFITEANNSTNIIIGIDVVHFYENRRGIQKEI